MHKTESGILLEECRDLMTNRMSSSMSRMMGYVEYVLIQLATVDSDTEESEHFIEAARTIRMKKREIQANFENRFISLYQDGEQQKSFGKSRIQSNGKKIKPLLGVVFQNNGDSTTIKNTLNKARNECRSALSILDQHVSAMFEKEEIDKIVNHMQPVTVLSAFWESCRDIRVDADIRFILVEMFERYVVADLHNVYDELNNLFGFYQSYCGHPGTSKPNINDLDNQDGKEILNEDSLLVRNWVKSRIEKQITKVIENEAVRILRSSAARGDLMSQYRLGTLYYQGIGLKQDYEVAALGFRRAAEQGNVDAQYSLGNMYLLGEGIPQNDIQARYWYNEAAEQGHPPAKYNLDNLERFTQNKDLLVATMEPANYSYEVPEFIHQFFLETWMLVLVDIYGKFSEKSREWDRAMEVVDELVRWTQFANDRETRIKQNWMLSGLVYRLKIGMKSVSIPLKIQAEFLSELRIYQIQKTETNE